MILLQLKENPFYILDVSIYDDKNTIQQAAEDKTFFDDDDNGEQYERAATTLTSPKKRIAAEMRWFIGCSAAQEEEILDRLNNQAYYAKRFFCTLAELNFNIYALEYQDLDVEAIMLIGALYERQDVDEILSYVNEGREQSGFPPVRDTADIKSELKEIREEIRRVFQFKVKKFSRDKFVQLTNNLADLILAAKKCPAVVEDFFTKVYAIGMDARIDELLGKVADAAKDLEETPSDNNFKKLEIPLRELVALLKPLDKIVNFGTNIKENYAEKVFYHLRGILFDWYKEKDLVDEPLRLAKILAQHFSHVEEFKNRAKKDVKDLEDIQQERSTIQKFIERGKIVIDLAENLKNDYSERALRRLESEIKSYAEFIKGAEIETDLAEDFFIAIRNATIDLHKEKKVLDEPLRITKILAQCFSHIKKIKDKADEDIKNLQELQVERLHVQQVIDSCDKILSLVKSLNKNQSQNNIQRLENELRTFSNATKNDKDYAELVEKIFYDVRSLAIDLYNEKNLLEDSLQIFKMLANYFSHVKELRNVADEDIKKLNEIQHDRDFFEMMDELKKIDDSVRSRFRLERGFESFNLRVYDEFKSQYESSVASMANKLLYKNFDVYEMESGHSYLAVIYNQVGLGLVYANRFDLALKYFEKALTFAQMSNNLKILSTVEKNVNDCRKYLYQSSYSAQSNSSGCMVFIVVILTAILLNIF